MTAPISPKFDAAYYPEEYDPHAYFMQFLEEAKAKRSTSSGNDNAFSIPNEEVKFNDVVVETKKKKSWKKSLFSWLKISDKKNKTAVEPLQDASLHKVRRRGFTSGPVCSSDAIIGVSLRSRKPMSGQLNGFFNGSNKDDDEPVEFPYLCLNQLKTTHDTHPYGPVYLVT